MVWEWGLDTLAVSTESLRKVLEETGLKAGLNFDGKGLEELSLHFPEHVDWLKTQLKENKIELWGGTYTQPYGSLIGNESNIFQRVCGIQVFRNVLDDIPTVFSEEEFDFFPQLPQILKQLGYEYALLFPQHTWHTPTIPKEEHEIIEWCGIDGSTITTIPYSDKCLMRGIPTAIKTIKEVFCNGEKSPLIITWLEMLDKPNWMWRTEFVIPILKEMLNQEFDVEPILLKDYFKENKQKMPSFQKIIYKPEQVFHGISVGKNGDMLPRLWHKAENWILKAEFLATWCSFLGRPYPQYDSYPEWQLHEAWKFLMQSQGHDAYECEGLTNRVGHRFAQTAIMLAQDLCHRCESHLSKYYGKTSQKPSFQPNIDASTLECDLGESSAKISLESGYLTEITLKENGSQIQILDKPIGVLDGWKLCSTPKLSKRQNGVIVTSEFANKKGKCTLKWQYEYTKTLKGQFVFQLEEKLSAGIMNSVMLPVQLSQEIQNWKINTPFAVVETQPQGEWLHRQPTGDWLTSDQREEWIPSPLCFLHFLLAQTDSYSLQFISSQNSLALANQNGFDVVLFGHDAWDGDNVGMSATVDFSIVAYQKKVKNKTLLSQSTSILFHKTFEQLDFNGTKFISLSGNVFASSIRKVGEDMEIRLFETEGQTSKAELTFLWEIEDVKAVDLLANPFEKSFQINENTLQLELKPHEILTLRVLFKGKRTEYPDIDSYRSIWVGEKSS